MKARAAIKPLKVFIEKMEELRDGVSGVLEADLESLIEQAISIQTEANVLFDNWEAEDEAAAPEVEDLDSEDDDEDDDEEEDNVVDEDFEDVT
jgi:hypothetical protein